MVAGFAHTCALRNNGGVVCWGAGAQGQIGNGMTTAMNNMGQPVLGITDAISLSAGANHTCAVRLNGRVVCWGNNAGGQIGNNTTGAPVTSPSEVFNLVDAVSIGLGAQHTCAVRKTGGVRCWGTNTNGQIGDGSTTNRLQATDARSITDAVRIAAGTDFTCAARAGGQVVCWGSNTNGQLGSGMGGGANNALAPVTGF